MNILLLVVIFCVAAALFGTVLRRWNKRSYSGWLYFLNVALGVLLLAMLVLRYGYEICLVFRMPHHVLSWVEFLVAPIYGAALAIHVMANHHFYSSLPVWRGAVMRTRSLAGGVRRRLGRFAR